MRNLLYILLSITLFSCSKGKVDYVFDKLPEQRMIERNSELQNLLAGSTTGWKAFLRTSLRGNGYGFYMKFDNANNVSMLSDWNDASASTTKQSTFRVQYISNSTLVFDTYNYISIMQDPNNAVNGGTVREGLQSDAEFEYIRSNGDSIVLVGRKYRNFLYLVKATSQEQTAYGSGGYLTGINNIKTFLTANRYNYVDINGKKLAIDLNSNAKTASASVLYPPDSVGVVSTAFAYDMNGVFFYNGLLFDGIKFMGLKQKSSNSIVAVDDKMKEYELKQSPAPVLPLASVIGSSITAFTLPNATAYAGWSADFQARRAQVRQSLLTGGYNLTLGKIVLTFNKSTNRMTFVADIPQGTTAYTATFTMIYAQSNGMLTFRKASDYLGTNASITEAGFAPILAQRLLADRFTVDYYFPSTGGVTAMFTSVEHPDFVFTSTF
ncbi:DUF4302 domain-containing protein [Niabella sp. 22666]|uniref:DUF4302 domain-containing protein n=1 Tax=Niabella sp. 22666 TaxID=3453954 RepID=UPI003F82750A